jgi:serine/threonine protein kinase
VEAGAEPVAGYRLVARLGGGGSGEVWRALGPGGFPVALKFIPLRDTDGIVELASSDPDELGSLGLMREIRHAHLLACFGAWLLGDLLVIGMELADRTLLDRCEEAVCQGLPGIPFPELIEFMWQAARGIDYLNEPRHTLLDRTGVGILHCDIKPHNLLLVGDSVKVGDFGLATLLEGETAVARDGLTPAYAAPEVFSGQLSRQSDQYSLAITYCRLRGGRLPFTGNQWEVILRHCLDVPDLSMLPEAERPVVARALAKQPDQRWPDCRAFVRALQEGSPSPDRGSDSFFVPLATALTTLPGPLGAASTPNGTSVDQLFAADTEIVSWPA